MGQTGQVVRGDVSLFCDTLHKQRNGKKKDDDDQPGIYTERLFFLYIYILYIELLATQIIVASES